MTEEDCEWFEENWNRGITGRKSISHGRSWKLAVCIWDINWDGNGNPTYYKDRYCWKTKRKTQYHIKKEHAKKDRKDSSREHWRYKKNHHTWAYHAIIASQERERNRLKQIRRVQSAY